MEGQVASAIATYIGTILFLILSHGFAWGIDKTLYDNVFKYHKNRRTIRIGLRWLFWRYKKGDKREIFLIPFIHEIVGISLFIAVTVIFIMSLLPKNVSLWHDVGLAGLILSFAYVCCCTITEQCIKRKYKKK